MQAVKDRLVGGSCDRMLRLSGQARQIGKFQSRVLGAALRMLVYERGGIVDLIVNHDV